MMNVEIPREILSGNILNLLTCGELYNTIQVSKTWALLSAHVLYSRIPRGTFKFNSSNWPILQQSLISTNAMFDYAMLVQELNLSIVSNLRLEELEQKMDELIANSMYSPQEIQIPVESIEGIGDTEAQEKYAIIQRILSCCRNLKTVFIHDSRSRRNWANDDIVDGIASSIKSLSIHVSEPFEHDKGLDEPLSIVVLKRASLIGDESLIRLAERAVNLEVLKLNLATEKTLISPYGIIKCISKRKIKTFSLNCPASWASELVFVDMVAEALPAIAVFGFHFKHLSRLNLSSVSVDAVDLEFLLTKVSATLEHLALDAQQQCDRHGVRYIESLNGLCSKVETKSKLESLQWMVHTSIDSISVLDRLFRHCRNTLRKLVIGDSATSVPSGPLIKSLLRHGCELSILRILGSSVSTLCVQDSDFQLFLSASKSMLDTLEIDISQCSLHVLPLLASVPQLIIRLDPTWDLDAIKDLFGPSSSIKYLRLVMNIVRSINIPSFVNQCLSSRTLFEVIIKHDQFISLEMFQLSESLNYWRNSIENIVNSFQERPVRLIIEDLSVDS